MTRRDIDTPQPGTQKVQDLSARDGEDRFAARLRGFGWVGIASIVIVAASGLITPLRGFAVLLWAWRSRTPWEELGFVRPKSWTKTIVGATVLGVALKIVAKTLVMPLLGADPVNHAYHFLVGNTAAIPGMLFVIVVSAGFGEEAFFRGYAFERLGKLLGSSALAKVAIVLLTSVLFALAHYPDQRLAGAEQAMLTGLVFGTVFAITARLFALMIAHTAFDLAAVAIIYWNLESKLAHVIFKSA